MPSPRQRIIIRHTSVEDASPSSPCGVLPAQSRRDEVGMGFRGISRGENLNVWSGIGGRGVVGKAAVV